MNRLRGIVLISNLIPIGFFCYCCLHISKVVIQIEECNIRDLYRGVTCVRETGDVLHIGNDFKSYIFFLRIRNLITLCHDCTIGMTAIQNTITIVVRFVILISEVYGDSVIHAIELE